MTSEKKILFQQIDFYEKNMELLKKYHNSIFNNLSKPGRSAESEKTEGYRGSEGSAKHCDPEIFYTSEGKINLRVKLKNGNIVHLHDKNDPEKEIPQFLNMIPENANGVVLLTGMGLCYTPMAILEKRKNIQYLAVFDLMPDIFLQAMHHMDLSSMLSDPRLILSIDPEPDIDKVLAPASLALQLESIYDLKHLPSFALDNEKYTNLSDSVFQIANQFNLGGGAILGGGRAYTANRFKNLTSMYKNGMIEDLKGKFKGIPAILVAGGPSLNLNIHLLPEIKGKAVILAVDSTLPALAANKVSPDFLTAIDPYDLVYEKFAEALPQTRGTSLITSAWVAPKVVKAFPALNIFWTFSGRNMENWMQEMMGGSVPTGGASTVAHLNLVAAILMGCSPIVFIGQDLAYTGGISHAENTVLTQNKAMKNLLESKDLIWTEEISGGKVPTDRKFLNFKRHFEDLISTHKGNYINSTVKGARIKGTEAMALEDVIAKYCPAEKKVAQIIASSISLDKNSDKFLKEFRSFLRKSKTLMKIIARSDQLHENVIKALKSGKDKNKKYRSFQSLPGSLKNKINEIDGFHKKIDGYKKIWGILDEITMEGLKKSERQKHDIEKLKNDPEKYADWLLQNLVRLKHINEVRKNELAVFEKNLTYLVTYFEKEKKILNAVKKCKSGSNTQKTGQEDELFKLARLYFENDNFSLLGDLCSEFEEMHGKNGELAGKTSHENPDENSVKPTDKKSDKQRYEDSEKNFAMINFYAGCVSLLRNNFDEAEKYFVKAVDLDSHLNEKIREFRKKLGDEYVGHAAFFNGKDDDTVRRMLIKGLKYSGGHLLLENRLNEMADLTIKSVNASLEIYESTTRNTPHDPKDFKDSQAAYKSDLLKSSRIKLGKWINDIEKHKFLENIFAKVKIGEFYRLNGIIRIRENKFVKAIENFDKAIVFVNDDPGYYLLKADACFALNDYDNGIDALNKAVKLDVKYAVYWENMGDNLAGQGKFNDAIAAYEQFFTASSENKMVLKKISRCFIELGQLQAAKDTLLQLKSLC